ncbi:MAG: ribosome biogenesis factor YjgA [Pseudohongiellaceae bacterium]|nr:ribosome biogenesis factor YjgA [Pseudohongiellaceae bacterium]
MSQDDQIDWSQEPPSKSQVKREMTALQDLGEELTTLNKKQLEQLPLADNLLSAIAEYNRLPKSYGARRRQLQFIGKIMRNTNAEEIQTALDKMRAPDIAQVRRAQLIESWGEKLLSGDNEQLNKFLSQWPNAERQTIRQLQRNYNTQDEKVAKIQRRKLLDYIKEFIE